jgi:hypothetical protein
MTEEVELGTRGKVAFGAACALCCALPMVVIAGVLSVGALIVGGVVAGATSAVLALALLVSARRVRTTRTVVRRALFAAGTATAVAGLWGAWTDRTGAAQLLVTAIAALAAAALLALGDARATRPSDAARPRRAGARVSR